MTDLLIDGLITLCGEIVQIANDASDLCATRRHTQVVVASAVLLFQQAKACVASQATKDQEAWNPPLDALQTKLEELQGFLQNVRDLQSKRYGTLRRVYEKAMLKRNLVETGEAVDEAANRMAHLLTGATAQVVLQSLAGTQGAVPAASSEVGSAASSAAREGQTQTQPSAPPTHWEDAWRLRRAIAQQSIKEIEDAERTRVENGGESELGSSSDVEQTVRMVQEDIVTTKMLLDQIQGSIKLEDAKTTVQLEHAESAQGQLSVLEVLLPMQHREFRELGQELRGLLDDLEGIPTRAAIPITLLNGPRTTTDHGETLAKIVDECSACWERVVEIVRTLNTFDQDASATFGAPFAVQAVDEHTDDLLGLLQAHLDHQEKSDDLREDEAGAGPNPEARAEAHAQSERTITLLHLPREIEPSGSTEQDDAVDSQAQQQLEELEEKTQSTGSDQGEEHADTVVQETSENGKTSNEPQAPELAGLGTAAQNIRDATSKISVYNELHLETVLPDFIHWAETQVQLAEQMRWKQRSEDISRVMSELRDLFRHDKAIQTRLEQCEIISFDTYGTVFPRLVVLSRHLSAWKANVRDRRISAQTRLLSATQRSVTLDRIKPGNTSPTELVRLTKVLEDTEKQVKHVQDTLAAMGSAVASGKSTGGAKLSMLKRRTHR